MLLITFYYFFLSVSFLLYRLLIYFGCLHFIVLDERDKCIYIHAEEQTLQKYIWRMGDMEIDVGEFWRTTTSNMPACFAKVTYYRLKKNKKLLSLAVFLSGCSSSVFWGCLALSIPTSPLTLTMIKTHRGKEELNTLPPFAFLQFFDSFIPPT